MQYDKHKYENLISESPLFLLDREREYVAFKRESYRMIELLYCYLLSINRYEYEPYGCEITEVAIRCISNYDGSKGVFLHYFNSAWKQEYSHIMGRKLEEEKYRGLRIAEEDRRAVRKYIKLARQMSSVCSVDQLYKKLSMAMGLPVERIMELAQLDGVTVGSDSYIGDDGEEQSLWDQIPGNENISRRIETAEDIEELLHRLESAYGSLQERQKPIVSDMITARICTFLTEAEAGRFTFISNSVMEKYKKDGSVLTQRDIAQKYGRDEASISRTVNNFLRKLKGAFL
jgi:hypothetical protein